MAAKFLDVARTTAVDSAAGPVGTTISAGIALADAEPFDYKVLLAAADHALYAAKAAGGDRCVMAQPALAPTAV